MGDTANVFRAGLDGKDVILSLGFCDFDDPTASTVPGSSVQELESIRLPVTLLPSITRKLVELGVAYQKSTENIGFEISEENGIQTVRI